MRTSQRNSMKRNPLSPRLPRGASSTDVPPPAPCHDWRNTPIPSQNNQSPAQRSLPALCLRRPAAPRSFSLTRHVCGNFSDRQPWVPVARQATVSCCVHPSYLLCCSAENSKFEFRNSKQNANHNSQKIQTKPAISEYRVLFLSFCHLNFVFVSDFVLRISDFLNLTNPISNGQHFFALFGGGGIRIPW